jgi:hypothetical protein
VSRSAWHLHGYLNDVPPTEFEAAWRENLALSCSQSPANDVGDMKGPGELTLAVALGNHNQSLHQTQGGSTKKI